MAVQCLYGRIIVSKRVFRRCFKFYGNKRCSFVMSFVSDNLDCEDNLPVVMYSAAMIQ